MRGRLLLPAIALGILLASGAPLRAGERGEKAGIISRLPRQPVESSGLAAIGYSPRRHVLEIEFRRGGTYRYHEVPRSLYWGLLAAESKAGFYNRHIRGKYRSVRVRPARPQ